MEVGDRKGALVIDLSPVSASTLLGNSIYLNDPPEDFSRE